MLNAVKINAPANRGWSIYFYGELVFAGFNKEHKLI